MKSKSEFKFTTGVVGYPVFFVLFLWIVFWFEVRFGYNFNSFGIYPRTFSGLRGIVLSPFIHSGIEHLYHNSMPLLILSMALFYFYRPIAWRVLIFGILISGFLTWCIARPAYHIGASGLIYVLFSFIFFKGIIAKNYRLIALSLGVIFLYGSMIWYVFPVEEGMSWEGHLAGLITGLVFALIFKKEIAGRRTYAWEQPDYNEADDPFLKHFDDDGNFIETKPEEMEEEENHQIIINYNYKKKKKD